MNPIATLALGAISAFADIANRNERGEIGDPEAARLLTEATHSHLARLEGFALGIAADDKTIADRIARLKAEFPTRPPAPPAAAPAGPTTGGG